LALFARTWNVKTVLSERSRLSAERTSWDVVTSGCGWQVQTTYELLLWDDLVSADFRRPMLSRLIRGWAAFINIVGTGTAFRYLRANWQYALFFLFPYALLVAFALAAGAAAQFLARYLTGSTFAHVALLLLFAIGIFLALLTWPGRRLGLQQALDDWIFSCDYVYGRRPDLDARLDRFAENVSARLCETAADEILIVGHSMGATLALEIVARALVLNPQFGRNGPTVCLLTVGSTIPKFLLHPAGERFRNQIKALANEDSVRWAEYHARSDAISFYKFDPVTLSRFHGDPRCGRPLLRKVRIQDMLTRRSYWRKRLRFMRLHYQFLMANELRSTYDFFMMVCGPIPFARSVLARTGPVEFIAADGAFLGSDRPPPALPCANSTSRSSR
jgi:pimeloyl-ACP methyl ester carboxylesterase